MARGKKTGGRNFQKGVVTNPNGRPPLPPDLKEARQVRSAEFESIIYKYMDKTPEEIKVILQQKDQTPTKELIVLKLVSQALEHGDLARLNFLLDRTIGKVPEKMNIDANVKTQKLHDLIMNAISDE